MITVKDWREINEFDPMAGGKFNLEGTVALIERVTGKSKEEIEALPMEDLLPTFLDCVHKANALVFEKINKMPKNAQSGESVQG